MILKRHLLVQDFSVTVTVNILVQSPFHPLWRWAEYAARMGEMRNVDTILVGKPEGKRPLGKPRSKMENIIRKDVREIWWKSCDWVHLAQDREQWRALVNAIMNLRVP